MAPLADTDPSPSTVPASECAPLSSLSPSSQPSWAAAVALTQTDTPRRVAVIQWQRSIYIYIYIYLLLSREITGITHLAICQSRPIPSNSNTFWATLMVDPFLGTFPCEPRNPRNSSWCWPWNFLSLARRPFGNKMSELRNHLVAVNQGNQWEHSVHPQQINKLS
jgi:hypothetical protein